MPRSSSGLQGVVHGSLRTPKISTPAPKRRRLATAWWALVAALAICPASLADGRALGGATREAAAPALATAPPPAHRPTRLDYRVVAPGMRIALARPEAERLAPSPRAGGPLRIGFHRALPARFQGELAGRLEWKSLAGGDVVGSLTVASPEAAAIRVALSARLPPKGEIRFFKPDEPRRSFPVTTSVDFHARPDGELEPLWSPVVEGDAIGVEVTLPSHAALAAFSLRLDKVSHRTARHPKPRPSQDAQCPGQVDVQCRVGSFPARLQDAVVRIDFEQDGDTFRCTATLLNNRLQAPYLLTANHCVSTPAVARTIVATWFHEHPVCGSNAADERGDYTMGSSRLLATSADQDATLLRLLNHPVPDDAFYSGWNAFPLTHPTEVYGIHHPQGDYKKYSAGETTRNVSLPDDIVNGIEVEWFDGMTEVGSSGSGLFAGEYLVGVLSGGPGDCSSLDWYGNFADFYPKACPWLSPDVVCVGRHIPLFLSASNPVRQGFARIINRSDWAGEVRITAIDDVGARFGPVTLALGAGRTVHFNSDDLERGNPSKGLARGVGAGQGDWRLELKSDLNIEALAYVRTADGFVTTMHDVAPAVATASSYVYPVPFFNPGSNTRQVSQLRLVNPSNGTATVWISGRDDSGFTPRTVRLSLPSGTTRTVTAGQLERGEGLSGALGDGAGKWQLTVESAAAIQVMNLLEAPTGNLANLSSSPDIISSVLAQNEILLLPLFLPVATPQRQGFVRVSNLTGAQGTVTVHAIDDRGRAFGPVELTLAPWQTKPFNSIDLERGNPDKGLVGRVGNGTGDWALALTTNLASVRALAYVRTADGFVTSMDDVVRYADGQYTVPTFNPGSNRAQQSSLRLINLGEGDAAVTITAIDDAGRTGGNVRLTLGDDSRTLTARELELGAAGITGRLGDGAGKWRLTVRADQPMGVMSLLLSPTGNLANLSTGTAP